MNVYDIIFKKRNGQDLSSAEMGHIIRGFIDGSVPAYQMSAFLMAVFFKGMSSNELYEFTKLMLESGEQIDLSDLGLSTVDKHSTGGVGDGVSISLAPLVASFGVAVPMMSGRGLGHTGGTLDKLEAIEGFNVSLSVEEFRSQLKEINVAMIGQTDNVAPADKKMYALRDVTATVDNIELIAASIMSKKLAEGTNSLILDVKTGSGAFMKDLEDAKILAKTMISIGKSAGRNMTALISDMSQPLGTMIGNALEIHQAIDILKGSGPKDIVSLIVELSAHMLVMAEQARDIKQARDMSFENLANGKALKKFKQMIAAQGGKEEVCEDPVSNLAQAEHSGKILSDKEGYISSMDTRKIGMCALSLGAGRESVEDSIDYSAGIEVYKKIGDKVEKGEAIAKFYSTRINDFVHAGEMYKGALEYSQTNDFEIPKLLIETIR